MLWTVFTTREHPPEDLEAFRRMKAEKARLGAAVTEIVHDVRAMPQTMRRLAWVQIFTALGFGELLERVLTNDSALVRMLGGDNRLTVVVLGGLSLAVAAALCALVTDPSADRGVPSRLDPARVVEQSVPSGESAG